MRRTKIVCTIGPASSSADVLENLIDSGMDVARLNFSHGSHESHQKIIRLLRDLSEKKNKPITILQDLAGPKIRIGKIAKGKIRLKAGADFVLTSKSVEGDENQVSISHSELLQAVQADDPILLADGAIELKVKKVGDKKILCEVLVGGVLSSNKGINLPGRSVSLNPLTEKDKTDLKFGLQQGVDYIAMSFVRQKEDIFKARDIIDAANEDTPIIAKIEKHEALKNIESILENVDGIMVARGDLAVETPLENVPIVQKNLIRKCNQANKPVITATQMLKSMVENPRPTRAEATDIANAVLDGTDAVMLSEETAVGKYPVDSVKTMAKIIEAAEASAVAVSHREPDNSTPSSIAQAVSRSAYEMAKDLSAAAILTPTQSGSTARMVSSYRPAQPIIALSPVGKVIRRLNLVWGVYPTKGDDYENSEEMLEQAKVKAVNSGLIAIGDTVVITAGVPIGVSGTTNLIKAEIIESEKKEK